MPVHRLATVKTDRHGRHDYHGSNTTPSPGGALLSLPKHFYIYHAVGDIAGAGATGIN